jgi:hypothetical protein
MLGSPSCGVDAGSAPYPPPIPPRPTCQCQSADNAPSSGRNDFTTIGPLFVTVDLATFNGVP